MRKSILLIALLFAIGSIMVACGEESDVSSVENNNNEEVAEENVENNNDEENTDNENDGNEEATEENENGEDIEETVSVGDTMNFDGLEITLNEAFYDQGDDFESPDNDNFVVLDMTIENTTDEEANVSTMLQMSLQDDEGYTHDAALYTGTEGSLDGEIGPGRDIRGQVAFDVNESDTYEFIFEHPFTSGQAIWEIPSGEIE